MNAPLDGAVLVGRDDELERVGRAVGHGSVLIVGEPGIGKTTVWRAAIERQQATGADVLMATPAEAEHSFSYSVLADLAEAYAQDVATLPVPQRRALECALLVADDEGPVDAHLVSVAVRTLLSRRCQTARVVIAIDDIQWADDASLAALSFALRRLPGVVLLAAARTGYQRTLPVEVERVELGGLSPGAIHHMVVHNLGHSLPRPSQLRLHESSGGNPFFALELARVSASGNDVMPESLRGLLAGRLQALPARTRRSLARAALGGGWQGDVAPAIDAGLVDRDHPFRFVHPLYAEAAIDSLAETARRRLHQEIAATEAVGPRRAQHLALAATGPDAAVAGQLDAAAAESARQGALLAAARLWRSAADLTPEGDRPRQVERMVEHGIALFLAGSPDEADGVLGESLPLLPAGPLKYRGLIHQALMLARRDSREVIPVLEQTLPDVTDPQVRHEVVALLASFQTTIGRGARGTQIVHDHVRWVEQHAPEHLAPAWTLSAAREALEDRSPWQFFKRAAEAASATVQARPAWGWAMHATALMREDRWDEARIAMDEFSLEPAATVYQESSRALSLSMLELAMGNPSAARVHADEVLCIGEQIGAPYMRCQGHVAVAEAATLEGDVSAAHKHIADATTLSESVHAELYLNVARLALGLLHLSTGDTAAAAAAYDAVTDDGYRHYSAVAGGRSQVDAIEALTTTNQIDRAKGIAVTIPQESWEHELARALLLAATGDLDGALVTVRGCRSPRAPFRQGRNLLLQGRWQRMLRQRSAARETLLAARALFESINTPLWRQRTDDELDRLGGRTPSGTTLTASERRVAELVAAGLSNKEVAARLVVSQRTVEVHLTKIYTKLEVPGRTALVARWPLS